MFYFKREEDKKSGKIDMLITTLRELVLQVGGPSPAVSYSIVHFMYSRLIKEEGLTQTIQSCVVSLDLVSPRVWGPLCVGRCEVKTHKDLSTFIHQAVYQKHILKNNPGKLTAKQNYITVFNPGMSHDCWAVAEQLLSMIRASKIRGRVNRNISSVGIKSDLDTCLTDNITRINVILNKLLKQGTDVSLPNYSPDTEVYA